MRPALTLVALLSLSLPASLLEEGCTSEATPTPGDTTPTAIDSPRPDSTLGEPSTRRVDAHGHPYDREDGDIVSDGGEALGQVIGANNLGIVMASVRVPSFDATEAGAAMVEAAQAVPSIVPMVWCAPGHGDSASEAEIYLRDHGFAALKFHPSLDELDADSPLMDPFLALAAQYHVPVVIHTASDSPSRPEKVGTLAERHPEVDIVLYHGGLGTDQSAAVAVVAEHPNTWLEISWVPYPRLEGIIDALGASRVVFGSDVSIDGASHYSNNWSSGIGDGSWSAYLRQLGQDLPEADYRDVVVKNTYRIFNLVTVHVEAAEGETPRLRFDNGHAMVPALPMVQESPRWWRRSVPAWSTLGLEIEGVAGAAGRLDVRDWEVWISGGAPQAAPPATTIRVHQGLEFGESIFLRGSGWPLSWVAGEPAYWSEGDVWTLSLPGVLEPLEVKALINDTTWEPGENHRVEPGETIDIYPTFD